MRILIELPSWLGDTVMATPAIEISIGALSVGNCTTFDSQVYVKSKVPSG